MGGFYLFEEIKDERQVMLGVDMEDNELQDIPDINLEVGGIQKVLKMLKQEGRAEEGMLVGSSQFKEMVDYYKFTKVGVKRKMEEGAGGAAKKAKKIKEEYFMKKNPTKIKMITPVKANKPTNVGSNEDEVVPKAKSSTKTLVAENEELVMGMENAKQRLDLAILKNSIERKEFDKWVFLEGQKMLVDHVTQRGASVKAVQKFMSTGRKEDVNGMG